MPVTDSLKPSIWEIQQLQELGVEPLRPKRQDGAFFMGANGIHRNRLAEALVCIVRLGAADWDPLPTFNYLFPPPEEDPVYGFLLHTKRKLSSLPISKFLNEVVEYKYG